MKYFSKTDGSVYAFEDDGSQDHLIEESMTQLTELQVEDILTPKPQTLEELKAAKNAAIDLARERANSTTFMFQGLSIAVDPLSKGDIMGAHGEWLTGQAPEGWPGGWKSKDKGPNGESLYVPIPDQATWLAFYRAMVAQGTANFAHAQALKAQLAAATTAEEVAAVPDW